MWVDIKYNGLSIELFGHYTSAEESTNTPASFEIEKIFHKYGDIDLYPVFESCGKIEDLEHVAIREINS